MAKKLSRDLLPPTAANAFRIGIEVSTVAWHYWQITAPHFREKHLQEIRHGLVQIHSLCETRGAMPRRHEIAQVIDDLKTWPECLNQQDFAEYSMDVRSEWDCSQKCDSDLLLLAESLTSLTPRVELIMDCAIRENLLQNCPQSIRAAYDFGKWLDQGRHSRRLPESIVRRTRESDFVRSPNVAQDVNATDPDPISNSIPDVPSLERSQRLAKLIEDWEHNPQSHNSGCSLLPIVCDKYDVVLAAPNAGETEPPEGWWTQLRALANQVGIPVESREPDDSQTRCDFVRKMTEQTIARLEKVRIEFGSWKFIDGKFQYLNGQWFAMSPQQTRLFAEFLEHDGRLFRTLLMDTDRKFPYASTKALNSAMCRLRSELKNNLKKQLGKNLPKDLIIADGSAQEFSYFLAPEVC